MHVCTGKFVNTKVASVLVVQSPRQGVKLRLKSQLYEVWERNYGHCNVELSASFHSALLEETVNEWLFVRLLKWIE